MQSQGLHCLDNAIGCGASHGEVLVDVNLKQRNPRGRCFSRHVTYARLVPPSTDARPFAQNFLLPLAPSSLSSLSFSISPIFIAFKMAFGKLYGLPVRVPDGLALWISF